MRHLSMKAPCVLLLLGVAALAGCGRESVGTSAPRPAAGPLGVQASFYPLAYFARRIGGKAVSVACPLPPDEDAATWMPSDTAIAALQRADLVVLNGAGFEGWVQHVVLAPSRVVDTTRALAGDLLRHEERVTHSHGAAGAHAHEGADGHTWLDPVLALRQADAIRAALTRLRPGQAAAFAQRFEALAADWRDLDDALAALGETHGGRALLAAHPAYNYLARRYGLRIVNADLDPAQVPDEASRRRVGAVLVGHPARHLLWEAAPEPAVAVAWREAHGLESVVVSPCENPDDASLAAGEDLLAVMRRNVDVLRRVLGGD